MKLPAHLPILLVEDDDDHAEIIIRGFACHHSIDNIHRVADGETALNYVFRRDQYSNPAVSPRPGLILLDLRLPVLNGLEVLRTIKKVPELRSIPVVMLTTSNAEPDVIAAYQSHANSYLVKSSEFKHISEMTDALSVYWLAWNRNLNAENYT